MALLLTTSTAGPQGGIGRLILTETTKFFVEVEDVLGILAHSLERGLSLPSLLGGLGLPTDILDDPKAQIDLEDGWRIINANQNVIEEETHLMSERPLKRGTTRFVLSNLTHCRDLKEGLELLADTYNVVHGGNFNFVRKRGKVLSYLVDDKDFHYRGKPNELAIELALINIHCALSLMVGERLRLVRVCTKRAELKHPNHHLQLLNCPVMLKHAYFELAYDESQATLPFCADEVPDQANLYSNYISILENSQQPVLASKLAEKVIHLIRQDVRNQTAVASELGMSVATLRRKLVLERTNFRSLLDKVNSELAVNYLLDQVPVPDIAEKLDYCDIRSFKRAFKRWHGLSPAAYLKQKKPLD